MALGELEFIIKLRQDLDRQIAVLKGQVAAAAAEMGGAFDKTSKSTSTLAGEVRLMSRENRIQNFLFRQGSQVIGASALALTAFGAATGNAEGQMKRTNQALQSGFVTFQGLSFALSALGPQTSLTVGALAGLGVAMSQLGDDTEETNKRLQANLRLQTDILLEQTRGSDPKEATKFYQDQIDANNRLLESIRQNPEALSKASRPSSSGAGDILDKPTPVFSAAQRENIKLLEEQNRLAEQQRNFWAGKLPNAIETSKNALEFYSSGLRGLIKDQDDFNASIVKAFPLQFKNNQIILERIGLYNALGREEFLRLTGIEDEIKKQRELNKIQAEGLQKVTETRPQSLDFSNSFNDTSQGQLITQLGQLGITAENVNNQIVNSTQGAAAAITDAMFGATQSIEQFFEQMAKNIVSMLAEQLLKAGILSLINILLPGSVSAVGVGGSLLAGTSTGRVPVEEFTGGTRARAQAEEFSGGQSVNLTINVNGDTRNMSVRDKRAALDVVEEIIMLDNR